MRVSVLILLGTPTSSNKSIPAVNMRSFALLSATAILAGGATASFEGNLNYHSPSARHENLGIDLPLINRRSWKRDNKAYDPSELSFTHGIASGDVRLPSPAPHSLKLITNHAQPYPDSVILWTRIAPSAESDKSNVTVEGVVDLYSHETEAYVRQDANPICVDWKVFAEADGDEPSGKPVTEGRGYTTSDIDFLLK